MKKHIYFLMTFAAVLFASCEPMEDIHAEVDAAIEAEPNSGVVEYTLVEDDYTGDEEDGGLALDDAFFTSFDQANELLPGFLSRLYPVLGDKSIASVTVEVAEPFNATSSVEYEVTLEDYTAQGLRFPNFSRDTEIFAFLSAKYPDAEEGALVELTYVWHLGGGQTTTLTTTFLRVGGAWEEILALDRDDYRAMGEAFANFDTREEAIQKIPVFLSQMMPYAMSGDSQKVLFEVYQGGGNTYLKTFTFDGTTWQGSFQSVLQFGHNGEVWEPDNTIIYNFTPQDYVTVGDALIEKYPSPAANVRQYASFEIRDGYTNEWTEAMFVEAVAVILNKINPSAEDGQKYVVNVTTYSGSYATKSVSVIKQGGVWVAL